MSTSPGVNQGNDDLVMTIDPSNPNIVYIGGTGPDGLIQVNVTGLQDLYSFDLDPYTSDGGLLLGSTTAAAALTNAVTPPIKQVSATPIGSPITAPTLNLLRNPTNPLGSSGTIYVTNTASLNNIGSAPPGSRSPGSSLPALTTTRHTSG